MIDTRNKTIQEIVDELGEKLIEQGKPCTVVNDEGHTTCAYGDGEGNHCVVGWFLPEDGVELMNFEGSISRLLESEIPLGPNANFITENSILMTELQIVHDSSELQASYALHRLNLIKKRFKLDLTLIEKFVKQFEVKENAGD